MEDYPTRLARIRSNLRTSFNYHDSSKSESSAVAVRDCVTGFFAQYVNEEGFYGRIVFMVKFVYLCTTLRNDIHCGM